MDTVQNQDLNLSSTNTVCALKAISVVCINPSDAHDYLANSYRPYQLRNNKLAATYDGAHGQDAKARDGCATERHGGEPQPPGRRSRGPSSRDKDERARRRKTSGSPHTRSTSSPVENMTPKPLCTITF